MAFETQVLLTRALRKILVLASFAQIKPSAADTETVVGAAASKKITWRETLKSSLQNLGWSERQLCITKPAGRDHEGLRVSEKNVVFVEAL